ncbi:NUDIX hydrolase [Flindersiella endophytica]
MSPYSVVIDVVLLLTRDDQVLLALRQGTGYADGCWNLSSGKLEAGEDLAAAVRRECREEIGLSLEPREPRLVSTVYYRNAEGQARSRYRALSRSRLSPYLLYMSPPFVQGGVSCARVPPFASPRTRSAGCRSC